MSDKQFYEDDAEEERIVKGVEDKLQSKTKRQTCPYCDNTTWFVLNKKDQHPVLMLADLGSFSTYTLSCINCGFIRQHLSMVLDGIATGETEFIVPEGPSHGE